MPGIFDRLQSALGDSEPEGITPLDIVNLPDEQRRILLWMLRDQEASTSGITADKLTSQLPNTPTNAADILNDLARGGWLISVGEPPHVRFKVNLRRKRGGSEGFGLWSILANRISPDPKDPKK